MMPAPSDLLYFQEISQTLNLSRAAERLGVSQPSLSLAMQRLELGVGAPLFLRSKKGMALTPAGRTLLAKVRPLLQSWEDIRSKAVSTHTEMKGTYQIGCHPSVGLYTFPQIVAELMKHYPELELQFHHELSRKVTESVISVRSDIGVVVNPVKHPDLVIKKVCEDQVTFWQAKDSAVVGGVLICDTDLNQTQELLRKLKRSGHEFTRRIQSTNLEMIAELTAQGAGIGLLPTRVAQRASRALVKVKNMPYFKDEIAVVYRAENRSVKAIQVLTEAIEKALKIV
jgi:DNA-binding transcriptional LysR family regulator